MYDEVLAGISAGGALPAWRDATASQEVKNELTPIAGIAPA
jgi:hypothetical protein